MKDLGTFVHDAFERRVLPALEEYVRIPARSPAFDPSWRENGHVARAVQHVASWCADQGLPGLAVEIHELPGRTPLLLLELAGDAPGTVLLYGHLDKQPDMTGWRDGLGPWTPVRAGDRLYGRGGADDGYAAFSIVTALRALRERGGRHARCVALVEASEESGSPDLPAHVEALAARIGSPDLVICLDSGCGDYERLWCTTSLRGMVAATLRVDVLAEGVHSGDAGGVVPSSFRIARALLDRLEDASTGVLRPAWLHAAVPAVRAREAQAAADVLGPRLFERFPFVGGTRPQHEGLGELVLARTWRPSLGVTGAAGLPLPADAGNVLRPFTELKLSLRLPPTTDAAEAAENVRALLARDPPHGAHVTASISNASTGWNAPALQPWLEAALHAASRETFGRDAAFMGEGGTIPFMAMLGERFPAAAFVVTGVLGPEANAHGPNEFLHVPTAKRVTASVARILWDHARRR